MRKACASDEQTYNFARSAIENMDEAKDIPNCNITKERVLTMVQNSYHRGIEISENTFLALKRRGHRPPQVILVGRALGRNRMVRKCVEDKLKPLLEKIFYGQDVPEIQVPEGADVGYVNIDTWRDRQANRCAVSVYAEALPCHTIAIL